MNSKSYLYVQLLSVAVLFTMAGCTEDELGGHRTAAGDGIVFGATAGYANPDTKTIYGEYNGTSSQEINWELGDEVEIYSPGLDSESGQQAVYSIEDGINDGDATDDSPSSAGLAAKNDVSLTWGAGATQSFYAIYPSVESIQNEAVKRRVSFSGGVLNGYIPINQEHTITKSGNIWEAKPNMDYLYMAAIEENYSVPSWDAQNKGVSLDFVPLTSTLEITFVGPMDHPMASFNVFADNGDPIAGSFTCDLNKDTNCTSTSSGVTRDYVTVSTYWNDGGTRRPLQLKEGEEIKFNVFLLPHENLSNLSIRVAGLNAASVSMKLEGTGEGGNSFVVQPHQKTIVKVKAPENFGNTNEWITGLDGSVLVSQLSIPGTANSFSYRYSDDDPDWHKAQTKTIEEQWNAGIRCFELRGPNNANGDDLYYAPLQCNRRDLGITFGEAVDSIWKLLQKHPGEFAMIMPAFESGAGRYVEDYANDLNKFFTTHSYLYKTYSSSLTINDARRHLLFIARITSEEDEVTLPEPKEGVFINQWGSLKDNWNRRGYTLSNDNEVLNWGQTTTDWWGSKSISDQSMEYYMITDNSTFRGSLPERREFNVDFNHTTLRSNNLGEGTAYVQDWPRVVKETRNYMLYDGRYAYWKESLSEKKSDIWNTFIKAIADNSGDTGGSTFYINSLDGYFVDEDIEQSYVPYVEGYSESYGRGDSFSYTQGGMAGNIGEFATEINDYFYDAILKYGENNIYGPMNIVILDRVYADDPSSYLPSVIINNNYRFPLLTSEDIQGN